ncbi:MAG: hypothetical protein JSV18_01065, partial [Candidatus Bathyarchaeota archaeon]
MSPSESEKNLKTSASAAREEPISVQELIILLSRLVPDEPKPSEIMYEVSDDNRTLWIEGWCDGCIAGKGFPPKGEGRLQEKLDHIRDLTPRLLEERAEKRNMRIRDMGFVP